MSHHGCNLIEALQVLNNLRLVGRLHSGKAASPLDGVLLIIWREVIKLATCECLASDIFILTEDADATADGHSCSLVVTWERRRVNFSLLILNFISYTARY